MAAAAAAPVRALDTQLNQKQRLFPSQVSQTSTQINKLVEPLVDSLSSLVLESIGGALKDVVGHGQRLEEATTNLMTVAEQVAISSGDNDLTEEIIHSINFLADQIESFVMAFSGLVQNRQDPDRIKSFSKSAESVGDAIQNLVTIADETSQKRMVSLTKKAITSGKALEKVQNGVSRGELFKLAQNVHDTHSQLMEVCQRASIATSLPKKRELLSYGAERLKELFPKLIDTAKELNDDPTDVRVQQQYNVVQGSVSLAYKDIVEAVKIEEANEFARLKATFAKVAQLIEATKKLQRDAANLVSKIMNGAPMAEREALAAELEREIADVIEFAKTILQDASDPIVRRVVEKAMADVREYGKQLISAARSQADDAKKKAMIAHQNLIAASQRLVMSTRNNALNDYPIHLASEALNAAIYDLQMAIESGDPDKINKAAADAARLAQGLAAELQKKADECTDPEEKARFQKAADAVRAAALQLLTAAKALAANPNSAEARAQMLAAQKALDRAIQQARALEATPEGFESVDIAYRIAQQEAEEKKRLEEERKRKEAEDALKRAGASMSTLNLAPARKPFSILDFEVAQGDDPLVKAAKEQALAALEVIREAEQWLRDNDDPDFHRKVREASEVIKDWCVDLVNAARVASANPNDAKSQKGFTNAQVELAKAIHILTGLLKDNAKVKEALKALQDATGDTSSGDASGLNIDDLNEFYKLCEQIIKKLDDNFTNQTKTDVQAGVVVSREVSGMVNKAGGLLSKMSKTVKAKDFVDKLDNSSKVICDNALKMKILAAVKAASGDDNTGQLKSAAIGLKTQIQDVVNNVKALTLRHRVKQTEKQVSALKLIAAAVRKARFG